jgi:uncharacterized protein YecT (DUF1311 family)
MLNPAKSFILAALLLLGPHTSMASPAAGPDPADLSAMSREGSFRLEKLTEADDCFEAQLEYPVFGQGDLDQGVRLWAEGFFKQEAAAFKRFCAEMDSKPEQRLAFAAGPQVLSTQGSVSIALGTFSDTGGAHPSHGVETLILDAGGKKLAYGDLFLKTEGLWKFLSASARAGLVPTLKKNECWNASMLEEGLTPKAESFKYFVLTPQGLTLIFPEYQVAPYVCGEQRHEVPLQALARFSPRPGIWGPLSDSAAAAQTAPPAKTPEAAGGPPAPRSGRAGQGRSFSPSFDCARASNAVEQAICADPVLAELDVSVAAGYKKALRAASDKKALRAEQRQWLKQTHSQCSDAAFQCIQERYRERLSQLGAD